MFRLIVTLALLLACVCRGDDACPTGCTCRSHSSMITCESLDELPADIPKTYEVFNCNYCSLPTLPVIPEAYAAITELFIGSGGITDIEDRAFANMPDLRVLDLKGNSLATLRPDMFLGAGSLESLHLSSNVLTTVPDGAFHNMPMLKKLDLDKNKYIQLQENALENLNAVTSISLSNCALTEVPSKALAKLTQLEDLNLHGNNFSRSLGAGVFSDLRELKAINLDSCHIDLIHEKAFDKVTKLKSLDVSNNNMTTIPAKAFMSFYDTVRIAHLTNNHFKSLAEGLLPWAALTDVLLGHNPWHCDCGIKWMGKLQYDSAVHSDNVSCSTPEEYQGQLAYNVTVSQNCYHSSYIGIYIAIPLIIILTAVIIFIIVKIYQSRPQNQGKSVRYSAVYKDTVYNKEQPLDFKV